MNKIDTRQAVALFYDGKNAPKITAQGLGKIAEEIIAIAQEHCVPLYENEELVALLSLLELGDEIPQNLYITIAQVIAFAYSLSGKTPENY